MKNKSTERENIDNLWKDFSETGKIGAYLTYCAIKQAKNKSD